MRNPELDPEFIEALKQGAREIRNSSSEDEACEAAVLACASIGQHDVMISFLRTVGAERVIIAESKYAIGSKFREISKETQRSFDNPEDLLGYMLYDKKSRFILDSRTDSESANRLCDEHNLITQYAIPLFTPKSDIGTLQIDLGELNEKPVAICSFLEVLAVQLSSAIEYHRLYTTTHALKSDLLSQASLNEYAKNVGSLHGLTHAIREFDKRLTDAFHIKGLQHGTLLYNFLKKTQQDVGVWLEMLADDMSVYEEHNRQQVVSVGEAVKESLDEYWEFARKRGSEIRNELSPEESFNVKAQSWMLREMINCLVINAIEAHARTIKIRAKRVFSESLPILDNAGNRDYVEISVVDDGDGIPPQFQDRIQKFGWTSKTKHGLGMGLTVVNLLAISLGGCIILRSGGTSVGENRTVFSLVLPLSRI